MSHQEQIEYWEPETLLAKLTLGARVKVRISGECFSHHGQACSHNHLNHNGEIGTIIEIRHHSLASGFCLECASVAPIGETNKGHDFKVQFKSGQATYAAIELEPRADQKEAK